MPQDASQLAADATAGARLVRASSRAQVTGTALLAPERATAFRAARRNTAFVKFMRTALPVAALGLCSLYVVFLQSNLRIAADVGDDGTLSFELPSASSKGVAMRNPRYEGFNKDGSQYVVTAKTATSDFQAKGPIALEAINGKITEPNRTVTTIAATRGTYDQASGQLSLRDGIEIESTSGLAAKLSTAQIDPKQGSVVSNQTVEVTLPSGVVVGRTMTLSQKAETVLFDNGVRARLNPPDQAKAKTTQTEKATPGNALGLSGAAANGPVVVTSKSLFVASKSNEARFETNVRAEQGSAALTATELRAKFARAQPRSTGPGEPAGTSGGVSALSGGAGQSSLETLTALGNVVLKQPGVEARAPRARFITATNLAILEGGVRITRPDSVTQAEVVTLDTAKQTALLTGGVKIDAGSNRSARASRAEFDQTTETARMLGGVTISQGQNRLRGEDLFLDQKAGRMILKARASGGRISARLHRAAGQKTSRGGTRTANAGPAAFAIQTDPNAPIDIQSEQLIVDDRVREAVFVRSVRAVQGAVVMTGERLVASYSGSAAVLETSGGLPSAAAGNATPVALKTIVVTGGVTIVSENDQKATGDKATFNVATDEIVLDGNVVLTQGRQSIRGTRLLINARTGVSRIVSSPTATRTKKGRMRAVFFPEDIQALRRQQKSGKKRTAPKRQTVPRPREAPRQNATSGWSSTTRQTN